ncbi:oxidoreductase [Brevundimonas variabilis]|uniref:Aryl-alcohol dehydrogenase-like predicted oxidoreductase n=1 Tax=Brevundimonas variabilis TaxID=74312 RepID=A0A7W9FF07_9CAUL|nr:oxidoreductase [Brevundimonas variabilis]MBB5746830.1 aryl-alcohol dehydrogenase-like predicted oxidoreductase [Brevundimonas variabilis]
MRYRPFGASGSTVSTLTLSVGLDALAAGPEAAESLIYSALETGINSYRLETADPVVAEVVGRALSNMDRRLLNVSMTLGTGDGRRNSERDFSAEGMTGYIDRALNVSGLKWFDTAILQQPAEDELSQPSLNALKALRATERVKYLGIGGDDDVLDTYVSTGAFDVLVTPYHVNVDWRIQSRVRQAREQDMAILTYDYFPESLNTPSKAANIAKPKFGFFGLGQRRNKNPLASVGTFAFLHETPNWSAEAICLAHAMTNPSICSVIINAADARRLDQLANIPERDMPPGLAAQIEMARVRTAA